jgi:ATP-binding cassette, subfamily F, member 3
VGVRPAYFAQDQAEQLDPANTVFEEVYAAAPASWDIQAVRDLLGRFLFSGEDQFKPVAGLSGGERSRIALAKLLLRPSNLLLLDEPTNHLDITTRERLEETLAGYPGTLVFATHDRYLVDRLATRVAEVAWGGVHLYDGGYHDYLRSKTASVVVEPASEKRVAPVVASDPREQRRRAADLRDAERQVTEAETRLRELEQALSHPEAHADKLHQLSDEYALLQAELSSLLERWEAAAVAAETV